MGVDKAGHDNAVAGVDEPRRARSQAEDVAAAANSANMPVADGDSAILDNTELVHMLTAAGAVSSQG
jgi:hypothetical protein